VDLGCDLDMLLIRFERQDVLANVFHLSEK
jgi:hypothetical protein